MTTPARNKNVFTNSPVVRTYWDGSSNSLGSKLSGWEADIRPASANAVKIGRFKKCAGFYHNGADVKKKEMTETFHVIGYPALRMQDRGCIYDGSFPTAVMPTQNMKNMCLSKALEKLKNQDFHLGNFAAEGKKTLDMVASRASQIARSVTGFRQSHPKLWQQVKESEGTLNRKNWCLIPSLWLELQYGWRPLLSDIYGALHHLKKRSRFGLPFVTVSAHVDDEVSIVTTHQSSAGTKSEARWVNKREVETFLIYSLNNPQLAELSSLGLINPLEIVWETMRYSFVVDWFLPIGSYLSGLTADVGYSFITGGQSMKARVKLESSSVTVPSPSFTVPNPAPVGFTGQIRSWTRECYSNAPFPGLYVKNPLSLLHVTNALALLAQAFR